MARKIASLIPVILSLAAILFVSNPAFAANQVVNNCANDDELRADLATIQTSGGGTLTFACGTADIPVDYASPLPEIIKNTTVDGGAKITLNGVDSTQFFNVHGGAALTLNNITLRNGSSVNGSGGAVNVQQTGTLKVNHAVFRSNTAGFDGGAIFLANATLVLTDVTLEGNSAESDGGAIYAAGFSKVTLTNVDFINNSAHDFSGAIENDQAIVTWNGGHMLNNRARIAGGMDTYFGTSSLTDVVIRDNDDPVPEKGGGFYVFPGSTLNLTRTTIQRNRAGSGGGIYNEGTVNLTDSMVSENNAGFGGGILTSGTANLNNSTLYSNSAAANGGGIYVANGNANLTNVTLSTNLAQTTGGAIYNVATTTLINVTIVGNNGYLTAGGIQNSGVIVPKNTVLVQGLNGWNCAGYSAGFVGETSNFSSDDSCDFAGGGNDIPIALGPLAANGGYTMTHLPLPDSVLIDHGTNSGCPAKDQRGLPRPYNGKCDAGAVEVQPMPTPTGVVATTNTPTRTRTSTPTRTSTGTPTRTRTLTPSVCSTKPEKPILLKPKNAKKAKGPNVHLDWANANCAGTYDVIVREGNKTGVRSFQSKGKTPSDATATGLSPGKTFFWRVTAKNAHGKTKSTWWSFKVK